MKWQRQEQKCSAKKGLTGSSFEVYVKTSADDDSLSDAPWTLVSIDSPVPSDDNVSVFREYEYTQENPDTVDSFSAFQVKVVMKSSNSSKSPRIRDLRVIALVT